MAEEEHVATPAGSAPGSPAGSVGSVGEEAKEKDNESDGFQAKESGVGKMISYVEAVLLIIVRICVIWLAIQGLFGLNLALIGNFFSGKVLDAISDNAFRPGLLTPVIPVWNDIGDALPFGDAMVKPVGTVTVMSIAWIFVSGACLFFLYRRQHKEIWLLVPLFVVTLVLLIVQASFLIAPGIWTSALLGHSKVVLEEMLAKDYKIVSTDPFSTTFNIIMVLGKCCGLNGPEDFPKTFNISMGQQDIYVSQPFSRIEKLPAWPEAPISYTLKLPPACCHNELVYKSAERILERLMLCAVGLQKTLYYQEGCLSVYRKMWDENLKPGMSIYLILSSGTMSLLVVYFVVRTIQVLFYPEKPSDDDEEGEVEFEGAVEAADDDHPPTTVDDEAVAAE